jgi:hypothetical protein
MELLQEQAGLVHTNALVCWRAEWDSGHIPHCSGIYRFRLSMLPPSSRDTSI